MPNSHSFLNLSLRTNRPREAVTAAADDSGVYPGDARGDLAGHDAFVEGLIALTGDPLEQVKQAVVGAVVHTIAGPRGKRKTQTVRATAVSLLRADLYSPPARRGQV